MPCTQPSAAGELRHCVVVCVLAVSLPRLVDFDWRVDVKTSSDCAVRMAQPTCLVQMKVSLYGIAQPCTVHHLRCLLLLPQVRGGSEQQTQLPPTETVSMEFSRETLDTMLDGLGRIRDQLASVAAATQ